jgi:lipoprotein-anchoring transpeptidase ErfK/SrfK
MVIRRHVLPLAAALVAMTALCASAEAELLVSVNKSAQIMTVSVDGKKLYDWPVSTGGTGYDTPGGAFRPFRMEIDHTSDEYDDAPMPYSIFFTMVGNAVHGTMDERHLGQAVSHGCIRLSVKNAATLWALVKQQKMANTTVVVSGAIPGAAPPLSAVSATPGAGPPLSAVSATLY